MSCYVLRLRVGQFQSPAWSSCIEHMITLKQVHRQADIEFVRILNEIRVGRCTPATRAHLLDKSGSAASATSGGHIAVLLCTHRADAESINRAELEKLNDGWCARVDCELELQTSHTHTRLLTAAAVCVSSTRSRRVRSHSN
jgi:hypothetical protein